MANEDNTPRIIYHRGQKLPENYLNETEKGIIKEIFESGGNLSAYAISKNIPFSYPGVFRYCKKLEERGILLSEEGKGKKNSKTNLYRITLFGLCAYFLEFIDLPLKQFLPKWSLNDPTWNHNFITESNFCLFFNNIVQVIELNKNLDTIFLPFLSIIQEDNVEYNVKIPSGLIYLSFINFGCSYTAACILSGSESLVSEEKIRENIYDGIFESIYDVIMNDDTSMSMYYINAVMALYSAIDFKDYFTDSVNDLMRWCVSRIYRINQVLPEKIDFGTDLDKIQSHM